MKKLERDFYLKDATLLSQLLLGKILVHEYNNIKVSGRIVETEAYMGVQDKAAHSYGGRRTARNEVTYGPAGFLYVYFIYGMYHCVNVVASEIETPQVVLIRALEPVSGEETMSLNRYGKSYKELKKREKINITNGPGKLCIAMGIDRSSNGADLCGEEFYIEDSEDEPEIVRAKRIGIDYAEEAAEFLWRYYIKDNQYVSKK